MTSESKCLTQSAFALSQTAALYAQTLNVFAISEHSRIFACLQSQCHEIWARFFWIYIEETIYVYTLPIASARFPSPTTSKPTPPSKPQARPITPSARS